MFWIPLLAAGGLQAGQALLSNREKVKQTKLENKARAKVDMRNLADAAQQVGSLGMMAAQYRTAATKARMDADREFSKARGASNAQAGAAGVKGASVDAVLMDLDREQAETHVAIERNLENEQYNLGEQIRQLQVATANGLLGQLNPRAGLRNPLLEGALSAGTMYANAYFQFGATGGGNG